MKQITCEFPLIDTTKAEAEVRASNQSDQALKNCRLPKMVGGKVHCLLGIQYSNIFPVPVRQLDCGLTIYRSKLLAHDKGVNSLIGGPHSSFQFLANKIGNPAALLTHFIEGLHSLRQLGAPLIPSNPMTLEEEVHAKSHHIMEENKVYKMEDNCRIHGNELNANHSLMDHDYDDFDVESPVTLREIRRMRLEQETGMDLDYRCVKCRDCAN